MASFKNIILCGLLATAAVAAPTTVDEPSFESASIMKRKHPNKCEAHIHIDCKIISFLSSS